MTNTDITFAAYNAIVRAIALITGDSTISAGGPHLPISARAIEAGLLPLFEETRNAWVASLHEVVDAQRAEPDPSYVDQDHEPVPRETTAMHVFQVSTCRSDTSTLNRDDIQFVALTANPIYMTLAKAQAYLLQVINEERTEAGSRRLSGLIWMEMHDGEHDTWGSSDTDAAIYVRITRVPVL